MKLKKRIAALLMAGAMVCSTLPVNVLAVESSVQNVGGLCQHHTEHNADCGYTEGIEGTPCGYICKICGAKDEPETATPSNAAQLSAGDVQKLIDALPATDKLTAMTKDEQNAVYADLQAAYEAYEALTEDEQALLTGTEVFESLFHFFNGMVNLLAENGVSYLDKDGSKQTAENVIVVDGSTTAWNGGWYVVNSNVTIDNRVTVSGEVHLILADNASLTVNRGINVAEGNSFSVYAQSVGENMGTLTATGQDDASIAGIGSEVGASCGTITINGGNVTASGGENAAGIGGSQGGSGGTITINGGKVTATGGSYAAGIGGGWKGSGGTVTIHGGSVTATGGGSGAGIGGGKEGSGGTITIHSGNVTATGGHDAAGIGGGYSGSGGTITIHGGNVTASGGIGAAGIGGGYHGSGGTITIHGGTVKAIGGEEAAGIGGGGWEGSGGTITIHGGEVIANGGKGSAGIGDGNGGSGGTFSTGTKGNAFIVASSISDKNNQTGWSGVIFEDKSGKVYAPDGDKAITIDVSSKIPADYTLEIPEGVTLVVPDGVTIDNSGKITVEGTLTGRQNVVGNGTVNIKADAKVSVSVTGTGVTGSGDNFSVPYGSNITLTATISEATNALTRAAANQVEFFVETGNNKTSLGTENVNGTSATKQIILSGDTWKPVPYTITAEYGGSDTLKKATGSTRLTVEGGDLKDATVTVNGEYFYTNFPITPEVSVTWNGTQLTKDTDYTVDYTNNTNAGKATVTVTGKGNYIGTKTGNFTIAPAQLNDATVKVNGTYTYTGQAQTPAAGDVVVTLGGRTVPSDQYTISASDNMNAGQVTATVTAKAGGNYTGSASGKFTIEMADPTYTTPTGLTATYGDTLKDVPLTDGWAWNDLNTSVGNVGENTFPATYNKDSSGNYNPVQQNLTVKVSPASYKITLTGQADSPAQITLNEAVVEPGNTGAAVSYGYSTAADTDPSTWQTGRVFSGLTADTTYYFFAKVAATTNYAETISTGVAITTPRKRGQQHFHQNPARQAGLHQRPAAGSERPVGAGKL